MLRYKRRHLFVIELTIVFVSIFLMNYVKQNTLSLEPHNLKLFLLYVTTCLLVSGFFKKFQLNSYTSYAEGLLLIAKSCLAIIFLVVIALVMMFNYSFSRIQMFATWLTYFILESIVFSIYYWTVGKKIKIKPNTQKKNINRESKLTFTMIVFDFIALTVSFFLINYLKQGSFEISTKYKSLLIILFGLWFSIGMFTGKFESKDYNNIYYAISPFIKSFLIMFSMMAIIIYAFHLFNLSRFQVFGSLILLLSLELIYYLFYHLYFFDKRKSGDSNSLSEIKQIFEQKGLPTEHIKVNPGKKCCINPVKEKLKNDCLSNDKVLFNFIAKHVNLNTIDRDDTILLNSNTILDVETIAVKSQDLIVNLHKINDIRHINQYFIEVNRRLNNGSYFAGKAHTIETHNKWLYTKFPFYMARLLYPFDFIYRRIMPKLPEIRKLYFLLSKGKNRIISKAEILGRLYFCGFDVVATNNIDNCFYYVAKRVKNPSCDKNPSYSPMVKLKRIGLRGKIIYIRKFRTMHPYSEYLQDYVYKQKNLNSNGKFNHDFRITEWGRWLRKLWIDELPQIINFWRGDINLVGVRALSKQYFSLYPHDLKELRAKFKPGLIPPYYVDLPKSFDEIVDSERKYLKQKIVSPFITDVKYFFKATYNILFKHARSQ